MNKVAALSALAAVALPIRAATAQNRAPVAVETREKTAPLEVDPASAKIVDFLSGGAVTASKSGTGQAEAPQAEPSWLNHWMKTLQQGVQPQRVAKDLPLHPLAKVVPTVIRLPQAPQVGFIAAGAVPLAELLCPDALPKNPPPLQLAAVRVLQENAAGWPTLGVELHCVAGGKLVRSARLAVQADVQGRVVAAAGVLLSDPLPLPPDRPPDALPQWPIAPALVASKRPAWILPMGRGWMVQVQTEAAGAWANDGAVLRPEAYTEPTDALPKRGIWWFDRAGVPLGLLLHEGERAGPKLRTPLHREALLDSADSAGGQVLVLQRIAHAGDDGVPTLAGYAAWQLGATAAVRWQVALPLLTAPGLWQCQPEANDAVLRCHFAAAGAQVEVQVEDQELRADAAGQKFAVPRPR